MPGHDPTIALTEEELREIRACLDVGAPLPDRYRFRLFAVAPEPLLLWRGKTDERCRETLPLIVGEIFAGRRANAEDAGTADVWRNLLVRADNRLLLSSLLRGPLRRAIEAAGGIKLMYIDPPFAVGTDFTMPVGAEGARPRALAYSDQWERGLSSFLCMIHERLLLMRDLLAEDGSLYLHCDWRLAPHMRLVLDEVFGAERFLGDIVWHYTGGGRSTRYFSRKHDRLLHYAASRRWIFDVDAVRVPYKPTSGYAKSGITSAAGRHYRPNPLGTPVDDVWDIPMINPLAEERLDYPTQKPKALLERIVRASSRPGDLVADFFCGSGSLPAVAESLGRRWLAVDSSPLAVHVARKRLLASRVSLPPEAEVRPFVLAAIAPDTPAAAPVPDAFEALSQSGKLARFVHSKFRFFHEARFPRHSLAYSLGSVKASARVEDGRFSLELAGFSLAAREVATVNDGREVPAGDRAAFASLLRQGWQSWLDYWSVGAPEGVSPLVEGMEKGLLCNRVLWHSARKRKGSGPELASPLLSLPDWRGRAGEPLALVLTIVDIFANESRLPLRLVPE